MMNSLLKFNYGTPNQVSHFFNNSRINIDRKIYHMRSKILFFYKNYTYLFNKDRVTVLKFS